MHIRDVRDSDLPTLLELTLAAFRPLFEEDLPDLLGREVWSHDHGDWEGDYARQVPTFHQPEKNRFVTVAEEDGVLLGYVGWNLTDPDDGELEMVAVHPDARRRGVGTALCREVVDRMRDRGVAVVRIGTGSDAFHAPARRLYESLGFRGYPVVAYARTL